jgi:hypothetical protein
MVELHPLLPNRAFRVTTFSDSSRKSSSTQVSSCGMIVMTCRCNRASRLPTRRSPSATRTHCVHDSRFGERVSKTACDRRCLNVCNNDEYE